jgi:hypothetical protein
MMQARYSCAQFSPHNFSKQSIDCVPFQQQQLKETKMKFTALSLFLLSSSSVYGATEVELIEERKAARVHHGAIKEGLCHNKPLDANMLIARVSCHDVLTLYLGCVVYYRGFLAIVDISHVIIGSFLLFLPLLYIVWLEHY